MDTFAAYGQGHIHPVIDEQRDVIFLRDLMKSLGSRNQDRSITGFVPILHNGYPSAECSVDDVTDVLVAENYRRRVCNKIEAVVDLYRSGMGGDRGGHGDK